MLGRHQYFACRLASARVLFKAEYRVANADATVAIVKLSTSYGRSVHDYLAEKGHAPGLLKYEQFGRCVVVVMKEVVNARDLSEFLAVADMAARENAKTKLTKILEEMHAMNYVHGDIREPNILVDEDGKFQIVDFDWAGEFGEVTYPTNIRIEAFLGTDINPGMHIAKFHDMAQLSYIMEPKY